MACRCRVKRGSSVRQLRRRCELRLEGVPIPHPFDLDELCEGIANLRGRPLHLQAVPGLSSTAPCGLWISVQSADYVFFDASTTRLHADHIILHELGHMLWGHSIAMDIENSALCQLMPDLDPKSIARILGRVSYTTSQEQEAEMLATLIRAGAGLSTTPGIDPHHGALGQLDDVLTFRV
jgi:hypothetical protein